MKRTRSRQSAGGRAFVDHYILKRGRVRLRFHEVAFGLGTGLTCKDHLRPLCIQGISVLATANSEVHDLERSPMFLDGAINGAMTLQENGELTAQPRVPRILRNLLFV